LLTLIVKDRSCSVQVNSVVRLLGCFVALCAPVHRVVAGVWGVFKFCLCCFRSNTFWMVGKKEGLLILYY